MLHENAYIYTCTRTTYRSILITKERNINIKIKQFRNFRNLKKISICSTNVIICTYL